MGQHQEPRRTPLHEQHVRAGARMVDFAGWSMPLLYTGIMDEHARTRADATVFDVSHMGRLRIAGQAAWRLLDRACTADVAGQEDDTAGYSLLCNPAGGVIDDIFVLRLAGDWTVVCNASNRLKVLEHLTQLNEAEGFAATIEDRTPATAMLAVQGPNAAAKLAALLPVDLAAVGRHGVLAGEFMGYEFTASRSGYTGEDGYEITLPGGVASQAWEYLVAHGGIAPAGLGARDVLRLEAGLPLYGHELNETIDPISAGLGRHVRPTGSYVGAAALARACAGRPGAAAGGHRAGGPAHRPAGGDGLRRRLGGRRGQQRHVQPELPGVHRDGVRRSAVRRDRPGTGGADQTQRGCARPRGGAAVLPRLGLPQTSRLSRPTMRISQSR